ncbi:MAG TPA: type II secretion system F family protein [Tepidisphaeraceae bacterium]|jgi:tight adherence protein B
MESLLLPILIATVVALFVWGLVRAFSGGGNGKKKLQERLTSEGGSSGGEKSSLPLSITLQMEAGGLSALLIKISPLQGLYRKLVQAWPEMTLALFLEIAAGVSLMAFLITLFFVGLFTVALAAGAAGFTLPFFMLGNRRAKRQKMIQEQIPESLDFLSRVLKAGHSFSTGIQMMSQELPQPLGGEFRRCYDQHSLGQPLEEALKDMAHRIESTDFAFFITAVLIQRQTGGDLSEVLKNIGSMIRQRIRLQQHVKAKTAEGRFTGYILVAFPAAMFFLIAFMNPAYAHNLTGTPIGHKMLGTALGLQVMGLYAIRKITTVKV